MRYALTFMTDGWNSVDTIIVEDREDRLAELVGAENWLEYDRLLVKILRYYGLPSDMAVGAVENKHYFLVSCDDVAVGLADTIVNEQGEEERFYA